MTQSDIKKLIYKQNPSALFVRAKKGYLLYHSTISHPIENKPGLLIFRVPFEDIGDGEFLPEMETKYLIRYMDTSDPFTY